MLNKRQSILNTALELFAENGYHKTSTKMIADKAKVSEALIFKHFVNKEQLLERIVKLGYRRVVESIRGSLSVKNPQEFINNYIELPIKLLSEDLLFWKCQFKLMDEKIVRQQYRQFMEPVSQGLSKAFEGLGYKNPKMEAQFLMLIMDATWKSYIYDDLKTLKKMTDHIKTKFFKS
ncbi:MAG TPA: helix-turn-helix domain-containing protein [Chitinophagales bacterium]